MALTAIAIKLDSAGPMLYSQERVGENGRVFNIYKFRSMRTDAESAGKPVWARDQRRPDHAHRPLHPQDPTRRAAAALERDARRHELRRSAPRASVLRRAAGAGRSPSTAAARGEARNHRLGAGRNTGTASSVEDAMEKLRYDLYYIKHLSIVFDLTIVLDTVKVILFGKGAK